MNEMSLGRGARVRVRDFLNPEQRSAKREREAFACYLLCGQCGFLAHESGRDPFRAPARDHDEGCSTRGGARSCPQCGAKAWHDLNQVDTALALRDSENFERRFNDELAGRRARRWGLGLGASLALPLAWGLISTVGVSVGVAAALSSLVLVAVARLVYAGVEPRVHAALRNGEMSRTFTRWRMPLARPRAEQQRITGAGSLERARSGDALLRAPLSGRPCLGYELRVLHDYAADDDPRTAACVLREQRCVDLVHAGALLRGDSVVIELPTRTITGSELARSDDEVAVLLRKRGLFVGDGPYLLQEAIVEPGARYELRRAGDSYTIGAPTLALPAGDAPELPRAA